MKHFGRWMICLGLLLNTLLFIAMVAVGAALTPICFAVAFLCYPLSLLLIRLAKNHINSKCCFYRQEDSTVGKILKTIFMPIVASGALIMFHLVAITYRKMNEAVEDKSGFSISSIFRTLIGFVLYFVASIIIYLIMTWVFDDNVASDVTGGILLFGGIVWLTSHILWDVMDFADKESDGFIFFKNIAFFVVGGLSVIMGTLMLISNFSLELTYGNMVGMFCMVAGPVCIHFAYYAVNRTGQVPQSKMTFFWGPIAAAATTVYSLLVALLAKNGKAWIIVFFIITVAAYVAVVFFAGFPFSATDGSYRQVYRKIAKDKRIERAQAASVSSGSFGSSYSFSGSGGTGRPDPADNSKISDAAHKVSRRYGYGTGVHISAISSIDNINLYVDSASVNGISYSLKGTLYVDLRGKDATDAQMAIDRVKRDFGYEMQKLQQKIFNETVRELESREVSISSIQIKINPNIKENIVV